MSEPIPDFPSKLKSLSDQVKLRLIRNASKKAGTLIRDEASRLAPRKSGVTQDEMTMRTRKESATSIELEIGPSRNAWYSRFVESGTKAHLIKRKKSRVLVDRGTGSVFGIKASHPGIKATPFLGPAVEAKGDEAAAVYLFEFNKLVDKAFSKRTSGA